jgi:hypothetical protein
MASMIVWKDGLVKAPDGRSMREVATKYPWTSTLWCSKDGLVWRRHWSAVAGRWHWADEGPMDHVEDKETGRLGVYLPNRGWTELAVVIATAWHHRAPSERATHDPRSPVNVEDGQMHAKHIRWVQSESNTERDVIAHEKWKPLKGKIGAVPIPESEYMISTAGRLKNVETQEITQGFFFEGACGPTRLAAIKNCGLCDLWMHAKLIAPAICPPQRIQDAARALMNDHTPADLSRHASINIDTAWSYCREAAKAFAFPRSKMRELGERLVARDLWKLVTAMWDDDDRRLDGPLNDLFEVVEDELSADGAFARRGWSKGELAFSRQCVQA